MKKFILGLGLAAIVLCSVNASADDNIANCEIVVQQEIISEGGEEKPAMIATYLPAIDFIFSVFDAEPGYLETVDDKKIMAVMCTRSSVLPTEFDFKLIETGVPFFLSHNFDVADSAFMAIASKDGSFQYDYSGPDLKSEDIDLLTSQLKFLNKSLEKTNILENK